MRLNLGAWLWNVAKRRVKQLSLWVSLSTSMGFTARQSQCLLPIRTRAGFLKCNRHLPAKAAYGLQKKFLTVITPLRLISLEFTP